ncbi:NYN domain-containing protein [Candidatus Spongiihabitans sp.]|uniref:NYN domain-containing protein n=1 Tax=Candidatus Spongiihabitans sp. TaxID=3101308 RepID=UPI003C7C95BB
MKKVMVYIDGFNLYYGIRSIGKASLKWLDVEKLAQSFLRHNSHLEQVKYFTAMIKGIGDEIPRQKLYLQALEHHCNNLIIIKGHFLSKGEICRKCNHYNSTFEEKKTDVNIACEMLSDAYENRFDVAFLVSGDSDLVPAVEKVIAIGKIVIVASPPQRRNSKLNQVATNSFDIDPNRLKKCLLPAEIPVKKGKIVMPEE